MAYSRETSLTLKKKLLLLFDVGVSTSLLRLLTSRNSAMSSNGKIDSISNRLYNMKHKTFHEYYSTLFCCQCKSVHGRGRSNLRKSTWTSLYRFDVRVRSCNRSKEVDCHCLCQYQTDAIRFEDLDIPCRIFIAKRFSGLDASETVHADKLLRMRNSIIHSPSSCNKETDIRNMIGDVKSSIKGIITKCTTEIKDEIDELVNTILQPDASLQSIDSSVKKIHISEETRMKVIFFCESSVT